mmetsp:Transcript_28089/g.51322  ORF Transcript_28089/g.51322 Transcript_28089/m.51322 type:complete len:367 (+) Transcript_28089:2539-3639(+)
MRSAGVKRKRSVRRRSDAKLSASASKKKGRQRKRKRGRERQRPRLQRGARWMRCESGQRLREEHGRKRSRSAWQGVVVTVTATTAVTTGARRGLRGAVGLRSVKRAIGVTEETEETGKSATLVLVAAGVTDNLAAAVAAAGGAIASRLAVMMVLLLGDDQPATMMTTEVISEGAPVVTSAGMTTMVVRGVGERTAAAVGAMTVTMTVEMIAAIAGDGEHAETRSSSHGVAHAEIRLSAKSRTLRLHGRLHGIGMMMRTRASRDQKAARSGKSPRKSHRHRPRMRMMVSQRCRQARKRARRQAHLQRRRGRLLLGSATRTRLPEAMAMRQGEMPPGTVRHHGARTKAKEVSVAQTAQTGGARSRSSC